MNMNRLAAAGALALALSAPSTTHATAQRTFVATYGVDNPNCSLAAPCRAFAAAIAATNAGGEVIVLDSGGYGAVTVNKSVAIVSPAGVYAGISVFSGAGVTVAAGSNDTVMLRGLVINAQGGSHGVNFTSGAKLAVERCTISGAFVHGIRINGPSTPHVLVKDTHIMDATTGIDANGPGGELIRLTVIKSVLSHVTWGINVAAGAEIAIDNSRLIGLDAATGTGVMLHALETHTPIRAHVANSVVRDFAYGADASSFTGDIKLSIAESEIARNGIGVHASPAASIALTGNRLVHNGQAVVAGSGAITSSGTNHAAHSQSAGDPVGGPAGLF